jgi:hypothetical protein
MAMRSLLCGSGWRLTAALALAALMGCTAQATAADTVPHLMLEGTGRVCNGHLKVGEGRLRWTSPYNTCVSRYQVVSQDGMTWVLKVEQSKSCGFGAIEIKKTDPKDVKSFWSISGFETEQMVGKTPNQAGLSCLRY